MNISNLKTSMYFFVILNLNFVLNVHFSSESRTSVKKFKLLTRKKDVRTEQLVSSKERYKLLSWNFGGHTSKKFKRDVENSQNYTITNITGECQIAELSCRGCCSNDCKSSYCRCDSSCSFFGDCCNDYERYCVKEQHPLIRNVSLVSCILPKHVIMKNAREMKTDIYSLIVNKCPSKEHELLDKCLTANDVNLTVSNLRRTIPVVSKHNVTYRNEFCAKCNGVHFFEYYGFDMKCSVVPPSFRSLKDLEKFASRYCSTKDDLRIFRKENQPLRDCQKSTNEICSILSYEPAKFIPCGHSCRKRTDSGVIARPYVYILRSFKQFTVRLDFSRGEPMVEVEEARCAGFYDPYLETCRKGKVVTFSDKENLDIYDVAVWLDYGELDKYVSLYVDDLIMINGSSGVAKIFQLNASHVHDVEYEPVDSLYDGRKYRVFSFKVELTPEQSLGFARYSTSKKSNLFNSSFRANKSSIYIIKKLLFFTQDFNVTVTVWKNFRFLKEGTTFSLTVFKTTSRRLACIRKQFYLKDAYKTTENGEFYIINATGKTYAKKDVFVEPDNHTISLCEEIVHSSCYGRRLNLSSEEYAKFKNLSIFYNRTQKMYDFGEYDIRNREIFICISDGLQNKTRIINWTSDSSTTVRGYLNVYCLIIPIVSLFLVIITHFLFPELRNLPGKNVMNLSISLFLAQLFPLLPNMDNHVLCHVMAALRQYLPRIICHHGNDCVDTLKTFVSKTVAKKRSKSEENKKFFKCVAFTWSLPAFFVIICVVLDRTDSYAVYDKELMCWFDNEHALNYLFVLPVGIILLFNVVVFSLTVYHIQRTRSDTTILRHDKRRDRNMLWIYVKISSLMGFAWLFGFLYLLVDSLILLYLFSISASLEGVYIAVAFVMKKSIWQKYKQLFHCENWFNRNSKNTSLQNANDTTQTIL
ncbi:LOW QUALITY PROTEIN: uncharacterized protein LOC124442926 [Xenia sp. Carnegie-2017]|uniref:LOW QUALITY PROTEIN: uncharacterized protein LOC124442926 n=1 Tax=Xenia sp. Carnegie-2017 TaxID=2897299 RepID=UPI001F03863F|nr:LOW QUALITY PROTEIN: uncharacterized protein LOC124442926 [Xenia sp. Carnegie-2017]